MRSDLLSAGPTFSLLLRYFQFLKCMYVRRAAWRLYDAAEELEVSERTIRRYVWAASFWLTDHEGEPLLACEVRGGRTWVVLRKNLLPFEALVR